LALKIDISKAYDRVDWGFLRGVLMRMGFNEKWIQWMMICVSSVTYSVFMNFDRVGPIVPGRGLRQGHLLSPYLFILVAEGLSTLIHKAINIGDIHGVQLCRGVPVVSHLLFADDCFFFCRENVVEAHHLLTILKTYEEASGQEINSSKSEVFFSHKMSGAAQEDLSRIIGVRHVMGTGKYLRLPSMIGRDKRSIFSFIKDRIWKRINAWRGRALSKAGKEVMIKSVLQSIPSYIMSIYVLLNSIIDDIEMMMNAFWWGGMSNNRWIKWMAWERVACPKEFCGMGFSNFKAFNLAMVAKQGWSFLSKPESLVTRVFKSRYFPHSSFLGAKLGYNPSIAWRSIWNSRELLLHGSRWTIGNGQHVSVMNDPWVRGVQGS